MSLFAKPLISVVISFLVVALVYSSISPFKVYAVPPDPGYDIQGSCGGISTNPRTGNNSLTCCWDERVPGKLPPNNKATYCQTCEFTSAGDQCKPKQQQFRPVSGGVSPLEEGVFEQPPTPPPTGPFAPPLGGVLQYPATTPETPPPLFGRNTANVPLGGGTFEQPTTVTTPIPTPPPPAGGEDTQSRTFSPTGYCVPFIKTSCVPCDPGLPGADCTPAGEWPPVLSTDEGLAQGTQPLAPPKTAPPLGEIVPEVEQPEAEEQEEEPQDDGQQEESSEGEPTAGPLT